MGSNSKDPLLLGELDPDLIAAKVASRDGKKTQPNELELQKEARLAEKEKRLNSGPKKAPSEAPAAAPPPPPKVDRSVLLDKILAYRERFAHLKKRNTIGAKSTTDELIDELHYIELQLGSGNGSVNMGSTILYGAMMGVEKFTRDYWNPLGLDLNGLGTVAKQNMSEFQPLIDELTIKHSAGAYTSPEWRLALAIGATVLTVNAANSNPEVARAVKSMNQRVVVKTEASDL
jgi:hypothetical protein